MKDYLYQPSYDAYAINENGNGVELHFNDPVPDRKEFDSEREFLEAVEDAGYDPDEIPEPENPTNWCNNASIEVADKSVSVAISIGDPRGGFQMRIERTDDGSLVMHLPYEGQPEPHRPIEKIADGTYRIL